MNKKLIVTIIALIVLVGGYFIWNMGQQNNTSEVNIENEIPKTDTTNSKKPAVILSQDQKEEIIKEYITANISDLSPEPEVLGGTFYVTDISFLNENSGIVEYEDGHIALKADFTYSFDSDGNPTVTLTDITE